MDWKKKCPVDRLQKELLKKNILDPDAIAAMEKKIASEIDDAFTFAKVSPLPNGNNLQTYLFCE
jgi:pyruvate dehydrogenase E1 component alpha subunit